MARAAKGSATTAGSAKTAAEQAVKAALDPYRRKRDFAKTREPAQGGDAGVGGLRFVVQKHHARRLHYDFRLELDGTLKSWAVPKGPCLDPKVKRMAVQVEDHPLAYGDFEGDIPPGQYGAGHVIVWDKGQWLPEGDARSGLRSGKLKFELRGHKLQGRWTLVRMHGKARQEERQPAWLLIKEQDAQARPLDEYDLTEAEPDSVRSLPAAPGAVAPEPAPETAPKPARASRRAALPDTLQPQLATPADHPPAAAQRADWLWELKYDGYRLLTHIDAAGRVRCFTRNGHDWSARLQPLVRALQQLPVRACWLDGEIVVEGEQGAPDFQALQNAFDQGRTEAIVYWLFDAPFLAGEDLRDQPLALRHAQLQSLMQAVPLPPLLRLSEVFDAPPESLLAAAAKLGFEGLIGKRVDAPYQSQRSPHWIKLKHRLRQEFVIGGYTEPQGARSGFGALMLGVHAQEGSRRVLRWCGNVGTGFDARQLGVIHQRLRAHESSRCPFDPPPAGMHARGAHWVRPVLVAEVAFGQWTREGRVRHAVFQGLREDKPAREIVREAPGVEPAAAPAPAQARAVPTVRHAPRITHAERVIDRHSGATKGELVAWYAQAAAQMLPHLKGRPVALLRAPAGVGGEVFFQKHAKEQQLPGVRQLDPALDPGHAPLLQIDQAAGLLQLAQLNTIELHTWNARSDRIAQPDRLCFDLDPGEGVAWECVQEGALLLRTMLEELGLVPFLKTSGGKGLHVVVPIRRGPDWDTAKGFAQAVVAHLARTLPDRFVQKSGPRNRVGRIFVDYLRNGFGATTACAWSVRARPGLGVSVPVGWDELPQLRSGAHWGLRDAPARLAVGNTPWAAMARSSRALGGAMRVLGYTPGAD
ncbi:DNA ligase D [Xenophilus arseniciresistens]|uniref:DNA ligase (ATP) n=1 Tax=Xenophilus arseniciresistens TaxID=1283306 RepID=A0AAE3NAG9_9BURK|nr:DNA ligase D [Xenophilus arseniciresistens]MDA7418735.1 DNA ligase D [Xenophilus arseniciresistens]